MERNIRNTSQTRYDVQGDIGYWINRLRTEVHTAFEAKLSKHGITEPQWLILAAIGGDDVSGVAELSRFIGTDMGSISRVVERLVRAGLIARAPGKDRKSIALALTPEGKKLLRLLRQEAARNEKEFFGALSVSEQDALRSILRTILTNRIELGGWLS